MSYKFNKNTVRFLIREIFSERIKIQQRHYYLQDESKRLIINERKDIGLRKYGVQEHPITDTVRNMTKYSVMITKVEDVAYEIDKAIHIATKHRMGPVWVDVPANIQTALMPETYKRFIDEPSFTQKLDSDILFLD